MWLYGLESIKVNYHPAMFGGHKHCGSEDMILVCHMILQDHEIKGSSDYMGKSPPRQITILPSLVAIGTEVVKT